MTYRAPANLSHDVSDDNNANNHGGSSNHPSPSATYISNNNNTVNSSLNNANNDNTTNSGKVIPFSVPKPALASSRKNNNYDDEDAFLDRAAHGLAIISDALIPDTAMVVTSGAGADSGGAGGPNSNVGGGGHMDSFADDCDSDGKRYTNYFLAKELCKLVGPTVLMSVVGFGTQGITVSYVGRRLGPDALASFGIGNSVFNLFGISIGYGLTAALDTLVSQSFGRHKQESPEIGEYIQRATLINVILTFIVGFIFIFGEPVFSFMFGHEMGAGAAQYTRYAVPYLFLYLIAATFIKVFQAIDQPKIPFYATIASTVCCCFFNHYFMHTSFVAAASVMAATYFVQCVVLIGFCFMHPKITFWRHCKWPATKAIFDKQAMREYFVVGIPSLLACAIEWWAFEVLQMIAASISVHVIAVLNITLSVSGLLFSVCTGMSTAAGVKVGNALGEGKPILAQRYSKLAIYVDQVINTFTVSMMLLFRYQIGSFFTTDIELIETFAMMAFVLSIYHWGDSTQMAFQGVFRGAGQQSQLVAAIVCSLWLVGLPLSYMFGSVLNMGAAGIMSGLIGGFAVEIPILYRYTTRWDWQQLAVQASTGGNGPMGH